MNLFTVEDRELTGRWVLELARSDARIVASAVVGSLADSPGDRWSDIDLTFSVADHVPLDEVLADWTPRFAAQFDAVHLFDLPFEASVYRVFLLPGNLQVDLSFTPASKFGARGPRFRLLFGTANDRPFTPPPAASDLLGQAAHHALRARFCVERQRYWQAAYWIGSTRDCALSLACVQRGLPGMHGRGVDDLPADVHDRFAASFIGVPARGELLRALGVVIDGLLHEAAEVQPLAGKLDARLRSLATD